MKKVLLECFREIWYWIICFVCMFVSCPNSHVYPSSNKNGNPNVTYKLSIDIHVVSFYLASTLDYLYSSHIICIRIAAKFDLSCSFGHISTNVNSISFCHTVWYVSGNRHFCFYNGSLFIIHFNGFHIVLN